VIAIVACGSNGDDSTFGGTGNGTGNGDNGGVDNGGLGGPGSSGKPPAPPTPPCQGLQCNQVACPGGATTSLSGKVYDPSGTVPLYNAIVYVPNAPLDPFPNGLSCDKCGTTPSGKPVTTALTDATGSFVLKNVPVGVDVPLVVQVGRWRRKVTIPAANVSKCADAKLDAGVTRLPHDKTEGDIPKIAITTGGADSLECFVRKMNVATEMGDPGGTGRIHIYQGVGGSTASGTTPLAQKLWDDPANLQSYDMVILSCEGGEHNETKSATARQNLQDYLDKGGRVFSSHFHYTWYKNGVGQLPNTATWTGAKIVDSADVTVDTTFEKGKAFSTWLDTVGATTAPGSATIAATELRADVTAVPGASMGPDVSRRWLYAMNGATSEAKFYSFNAPIGLSADQQCGRGVFTDIHVSSGDASGGSFPGNCTTSGYTPQEKALLFLLMDLASCIQDDNSVPTAPPPDPGGVH
jgi:hypothetical protein